MLAFILIAAGLLSVFYGIFIATARSGSLFFIVWLLLGVMLIALGIGKRYGWFVGLPAFLKKSLFILLIGLASLVIFLTAFVLSGFKKHESKDLDVIIVLGAQIRSDGPSNVLKMRLDTAASYLKAHPDTRCITSGGQGFNEPEPEGDFMKRYLVRSGISADRIVAESESKNTSENLRFSGKLIDLENNKIGIVTNNFHVKRSCLIARHLGYKNLTGLPAPSRPVYLLNNVFREEIAILKDLAVGNI